jgi:hypothetical protein
MTTDNLKNESCKACNGTGVQVNIYTGIRVKCPACGGTGDWGPCFRPGEVIYTSKSPSRYFQPFWKS